MTYPPLPDCRYAIVYCDPPWKYRDKIKGKHNVGDKYPTLSMKRLKQLPVQEIAERDCLLFLWTTGPCLRDAIDLGEAWGFRYATMAFVWWKTGRPLFGNYTLGQCEFVLVMKIGRIPSPRGARNMRQFFTSKRGSHSAKPLAIKERINKMFPWQRKIELFARREKNLLYDSDTVEQGWDFWGYEAE